MIEAARKYQCVACSKYKKPNEAAPASMPLTRQFNDTVQADVFYIKLQEHKHPVLSLVDVATPISWTMRPLTPMSRLWRRCGFGTLAHQSSW